MSTLFQNERQKSWFGVQVAVLIYWKSFRGMWELVFLRKIWGVERLAALVKLDTHHEKEVTLSLNWYNRGDLQVPQNRKIWMWILSSRVLGVWFWLWFGLAFLSSPSFAYIIFVYHSLALLALTSQINVAQCKYHAQLYYLINKCTC